MRIPSGVTDQYVYFVAVDPTDLTSRVTGLSQSPEIWTVYRSRNGGAPSAMTTPTINETDATNMPGVYELLLDEDTTVAAGNQSEEMALHITAISGSPLADQMAPVTRTIELYRPSVTAGETLVVSGGLATANTTQISGNTAAADNAQAMFDGTGYAGGSIKLGVDVTAISGDTPAANALEAAYDGTTPTVVNVTQVAGSSTAGTNLGAMYNGTGYAGGTTKMDVNVATINTDAVDAASLNADAVTEITDDIMAEVVETQGSYTVQQVLSIVLSVLAGETSNSGNTLSTPDGVATRVAATTNGSNERTAMTLTPSS